MVIRMGTRVSVIASASSSVSITSMPISLKLMPPIPAVTPNLRDATREQIEAFITNLADWATRDRPALLCKLNSYSRSQEVTS